MIFQSGQEFCARVFIEPQECLWVVRNGESSSRSLTYNRHVKIPLGTDGTLPTTRKSRPQHAVRLRICQKIL